jgi:hypothetical protein
MVKLEPDWCLGWVPAELVRVMGWVMVMVGVTGRVTVMGWVMGWVTAVVMVMLLVMVTVTGWVTVMG